MTGMTAPLPGLERTSLREQAVSALRTAITSGELEPGRHLVESELSEMLRISRGTLREALRQLEQEGLLSAGPRGRLSVRRLDEKEIREIYVVRAALETLAARALCELPNRQHVISMLKAALDTMKTAEKQSLQAQVEADLEFHRTLCRLTGNGTLLHTWESLEGAIRMSIMYAGLEKGVQNMSADRHQDIVAAIETADVSLAGRTLREHLEEAAENLVA